MVVILEYRIHFLLAFIILLIFLIIIPVRVETAEVSSGRYASSQADDFQNRPWDSRAAWGNFIENKLHVLSLTENSRTDDKKNSWIINEIFDVHLYTSNLPHGQITTSGDSDDVSVQDFQTTIHPLLEISYSLTEKIALELRGHMNRHTSGTDTSSRNAKKIFGYTFIFGPSVYGGKSGDPVRVYTHFGLGYKLLENCRYRLSGDSTSSMGTGFSLGFRMKKSDIRLGFNYFKSLAENSLHLVPGHKEFNPSSIFLTATYNLGK